MKKEKIEVLEDNIINKIDNSNIKLSYKDLKYRIELPQKEEIKETKKVGYLFNKFRINFASILILVVIVGIVVVGGIAGTIAFSGMFNKSSEAAPYEENNSNIDTSDDEGNRQGNTDPSGKTEDGGETNPPGGNTNKGEETNPQEKNSIDTIYLNNAKTIMSVTYLGISTISIGATEATRKDDPYLTEESNKYTIELINKGDNYVTVNVILNDNILHTHQIKHPVLLEIINDTDNKYYFTINENKEYVVETVKDNVVIATKVFDINIK